LEWDKGRFAHMCGSTGGEREGLEHVRDNWSLNCLSILVGTQGGHPRPKKRENHQDINLEEGPKGLILPRFLVFRTKRGGGGYEREFQEGDEDFASVVN